LNSGQRTEVPDKIAPESLQKIITKFYEVTGSGVRKYYALEEAHNSNCNA